MKAEEKAIAEMLERTWQRAVTDVRILSTQRQPDGLVEVDFVCDGEIRGRAALRYCFNLPLVVSCSAFVAGSNSPRE